MSEWLQGVQVGLIRDGRAANIDDMRELVAMLGWPVEVADEDTGLFLITIPSGLQDHCVTLRVDNFELAIDWY